jgi:hypothetical protein
MDVRQPYLKRLPVNGDGGWGGSYPNSLNGYGAVERGGGLRKWQVAGEIGLEVEGGGLGGRWWEESGGRRQGGRE